MNSRGIPSSLPYPLGSTPVDPEIHAPGFSSGRLSRLNENIRKTDQEVWEVVA
jgi:hypothetical protein